MNNHVHNRYRDMDSENNSGRAIALFPGAYRPPHAGHYHAVIDLACRKEIDEVVIFISNRNRNLPDTSRAMGPEVAEKIWSPYLIGMSKIRVEVAAGSAVQQALAYFEQVNARDRLLFCLGEADFESGDNRFEAIDKMVARSDVNAEVIAAPTSKFTTRAT